ncbi:MAG: DNA polymerase III subunit gamma/tau [Clostridiales bacterium]|jgi:DNA polymerase-3 subunit gamma/tau|nr:DNA polymerase III subunit gamma/tau [Clostridiales bacterium]
MSVSLYRNFRPSAFKDVVGQEHIVRTLVNQIKTGNISHAYIFTGTRGTGKTTTAKIFARAVNCLKPIDGSPCGKCAVCLSGADGIDIIELDGASNNGVDEIRALRDNSNFPPVNSKYKVYIIDEVHMLSINAFNALLKTLEEPPAHMIFILATTEIHKVPQTVLSRCMRFDFRLVPTDIIADRISKIFGELKVKCEKEAAYALAKLGEGSVRDALSYADIALAYSGGDVTYRNVLDALMVSPPDAYIPLADDILSGNIRGALSETDRMLGTNSNVNIIRRELCDFFRNLIFIRASDGASVNVTKDLFDAMKPLAERYDPKLLYRALDIFAKLESDMRYSSNPRILLESAVIKAADSLTETDESGLVIRIKNLENRLAGLSDAGEGLKKNVINAATQEKNATNDAADKKDLSKTRTQNIAESGIQADAAANAASGIQADAAANAASGIEAASHENKPHAYPEARVLLGKVINTFRKRGLFQLYTSFLNVYDAEINGNELLVFFTDDADYNSFSIVSNKTAAQEILNESEASLKIKAVLKKTNGQNVQEETERLKELFDGNFKTKS